MTHYPYLIIGSGMTAAAAARGIRKVDPEGMIAVLGDEPHAPYQRPPLSKGLWKGKKKDEVWCKMPADNVDLHLSRQVTAIDRESHTIVDDAGRHFGYDKLLLATGGAPRRLPQAMDGLIHFRTLDDYRTLRVMAESKGHIAVIGGGFIGSEVAAALAMNDCRVTMIFPDEYICAHIFPAALARHVSDSYRARGVELLSGTTVNAVARQGQGYRLNTTAGHDLAVDGVVVGIGTIPNTWLAESAGLTVDNGIHVDEFLRTSDASIYAAGDVANFHNPALNRRMRVEHEDNAISMGGVAGGNMAGQHIAYMHLPFFYSDLFDMGYEAVGLADSRLQMVEAWQEPFDKGVVYYLEEGRVRGVLLWNVWDQVEAATRLIAGGEKLSPDQLRHRLTE